MYFQMGRKFLFLGQNFVFLYSLQITFFQNKISWIRSEYIQVSTELFLIFLNFKYGFLFFQKKGTMVPKHINFALEQAEYTVGAHKCVRAFVVGFHL